LTLPSTTSGVLKTHLGDPPQEIRHMLDSGFNTAFPDSLSDHLLQRLAIRASDT
jgi:hypothetical protein